MSADSITRTKKASVSSGSLASSDFNQTLIAQASVPKLSSHDKRDVEYSGTLFGGVFKAQRSAPSSKTWYWGYTGKDAKGNPVNIVGQVTLTGRFTDKELLNGSRLKDKIVATRGGQENSTHKGIPYVKPHKTAHFQRLPYQKKTGNGFADNVRNIGTDIGNNVADFQKNVSNEIDKTATKKTNEIVEGLDKFREDFV